MQGDRFAAPQWRFVIFCLDYWTTSGKVLGVNIGAVTDVVTEYLARPIAAQRLTAAEPMTGVATAPAPAPTAAPIEPATKAPVTPPAAAAPGNGFLRVGAAYERDSQSYHCDKLSSNCLFAYSPRLMVSDLDGASLRNRPGARLCAVNRCSMRHAPRRRERQSYGNDKCQRFHQRFPRRRKHAVQVLITHESAIRKHDRAASGQRFRPSPDTAKKRVAKAALAPNSLLQQARDTFALAASRQVARLLVRRPCLLSVQGPCLLASRGLPRF